MGRKAIHLTPEARREAAVAARARYNAKLRLAKALPGVTGPVELLEALAKNNVERRAILKKLEAEAARLRAEQEGINDLHEMVLLGVDPQQVLARLAQISDVIKGFEDGDKKGGD